ncbi:oligogalacturonate-specific porin KdgM family protein, partial [Klebsiella grimontii]
SAGVILADNESYDWTHDFKLTYKFDKNWSPYMAIANVSGSKATDERQTRYRVGVKYSF